MVIDIRRSAADIAADKIECTRNNRVDNLCIFSSGRNIAMRSRIHVLCKAVAGNFLRAAAVKDSNNPIPCTCDSCFDATFHVAPSVFNCFGDTIPDMTEPVG